ncbi:MAG: cyclic nucleotide-binding domain-containing protein [Spongiibacteraceae bacterium]
MSRISTLDPLTFVKQFSPLDRVDKKYYSNLSKQLTLQQVKKGTTFIKKKRQQDVLHFLVEGNVEIRKSFDQRISQSAKDKQSRKAIETRLPPESSVKALEDCLILSISNTELSQLLPAPQHYTIDFLDSGDIPLDDDQLIDDDYQEDWDNRFIRSNLATNLPSTVIQQLFSQLEDIPTLAGETIVKANTPGDYFYIIKRGSAIVTTAIEGPYEGAQFSLSQGDYFGDEALVAETPRNATVTMNVDGVLGRLDQEGFNTLVKKNLITPISKDYVSSMEGAKILDVRFAIEYKKDHQKDSINIPISFLRQRLPGFNKSLVYLITPADDRRSELATYIMRQAGYKAYLHSEHNIELDLESL